VIVAAARALESEALSGFLLADAIVVAVLLIGRQVLAILENASLQNSLQATVAELGDRERHFRSLVQRSSDVVSVVDRNLRVTYVSPAVLGVLGYPAAGLVGTTIDAFVHPDDSPALLAEVMRLRRDPKLVGRVEARWRHQREGWRHCETTITNLSDDPAIRGFVLNTRDVTERKEAELELAHRARHDALTGLHTRGPFVELLASTIGRAGPESPVALLFVDLDRFKVINDSLGHDAGDDVLTVVASRFMAAIAGSGAVGRFGGDEFVAVLAAGLDEAEPDDVTPAAPLDPVDLAHRLLRSVRRPMTIGGREVFLSCSIGVATTDQPTTTPDALIRDADVAMYAAKERGRNCVEVFGPGLRGPSVDRLDMESELHRGAARGEFLVLYQPVFDLSTGAVSGFEGLVRWQHPTRGLLLPDEFLQAAEDTGLIVQIGAHIIRTACTDFAALRRAGHAADVMINLSARQLAEPDIVETIERAVREAHLPTSGVCFEVTEGVIIDAETPVAALRTLRGLGYRLAVDDFGTGYASLTHLRRLPITALKVDKSFVAGLGEDDGATAIVAAITHMARALGISVVAEGIETHEQVAELRAVGCPYGQGYLLGPPVRADRLVTVVEQALSPTSHTEPVESESAVTAHRTPA
jgi:diguanylate cyclase (GGDEF)-like protein/PAS domain S-box-containing protein